MAGGMKRNTSLSQLKCFTISERPDARFLADALSQQSLARGRAKILAATAAGVVTMGVGDEGVFDRSVRVDVK